MKRLNLIGGLAGLLALGSCCSVQAAISCATGDYNGTYAFFTTGYFLQLPPAAASLMGPFAQAGTFTSDGQGNATIASTASYNGLIQPANVPATYVLNPDCTITFSLTLPPPLSVPSTFQGVFSQDNGQLSLMITSPGGSTVVGTHIKQYVQNCKLSTLNGAYAIDMEGSTNGILSAAGAAETGTFRRIGRVIADGAGNFTATTLADYNGQIVTENFNGTYTLGTNCVVSLIYTNGTNPSAQNAASRSGLLARRGAGIHETAGGQTITISGPLASAGQSAMVMVATQGWAVSGTLKAVQH
jgi:hypothetical protein